MNEHVAKIQVKDIQSSTPFHAGLEFTPQTRGTWTIAHTPLLIPESHEIFVCPQGCLRGVVLSAAEAHGMDRFSMVTVTEDDLYNGKIEELFIDGVSDIVEHLDPQPPLVMTFTSCVHHFVAIDLDLVFKELNQRFPDICFVENYMNCPMRHSKVHYESMTTKQLYAGLQPTKQDGSINIIGNYFTLDRDSEIFQIIGDAKDLCQMRTFDEYLEMAASSYNIYNAPVAIECVQDLEKRLNQKPIYMPYSWDIEEIKQDEAKLMEILGIYPDLSRYEKDALRALEKLHDAIKDIEIQIDMSATPRPLSLAKLLLEHGFHVTTVYTDTILPGEEKALAWLQEHHPDLMVCACVDFRCRTWQKSTTPVLALGQKAAYDSGTDHFVNMIVNDGMYGFVAIRKLCEKMLDAYIYPKETQRILDVKARGCVL